MTGKLFELRRRTFDTPHFRGIEFIEVEAKSIINKVPGTYLPFNWTINPYRGCSHACSYCASPDTPILMTNGTTMPIAELKVGDRIYGTQRVGNYRRYVATEVKAQWSTVKEAYRITLEDGTQLVTSADHRFLTDRGWKHVTGTEQGRERRPFLTLKNKLIGTGSFPEPPKPDSDYERGYLCGMVRGDGSLGAYSYSGRARHHFRLALADVDALDRAESFLRNLGVPTTRYLFQQQTAVRRPIWAIHNQTRDGFQRVSYAIEWPRSPSDSWMKGFLAGIFDAEGHCSQSVFRICNQDPTIIYWIERCLGRFEFDTKLEKRDDLFVVRMCGGLRERLRFFLLTDPAITRKRAFEGMALKSDAKLNVEAIEPLGIEIPMFDITTGTGDFIANGVVSHNCFARVTHTYMDMDAGRDFETKIVVKVNAPELLRKQLRRKSWTGETIAMGTGTDPYQRAEGRYKLMPRIIEALTEVRNPFSILTKGTLILRDLDLITEAASLTDVSTAFSIGTLDEDVWRKSEPGTPHPRKRVEAVKKLNDAGIPCGVLVAPILPGISDGRDQIRTVVEACVEAGATFVSPILLHLRPVVRDVYMEWLKDEYPELIPRYEQMYPKAYAARSLQTELREEVSSVITDAGGLRRSRPRPKRNARWQRKVKREPDPDTQQLSLL